VKFVLLEAFLKILCVEILRMATAQAFDVRSKTFLVYSCRLLYEIGKQSTVPFGWLAVRISVELPTILTKVFPSLPKLMPTY
jgi:hypothetical protein